ncbi:hypothetical protein C7420_101693 [Pantoea ananatis]|uniref:HEPN domain-containing protein n=1 Tax=Pantoea ananas TaxID=553 RepID=UPI000DC2728A|nr:HEPN domain-containing protein [Pantoea ananatis]RAR75077.1 hypothetical protein C7420_101693 [Pantoea ananatis]
MVKIKLTKTPAMIFSRKLVGLALIQRIEKDLEKLHSIEGYDVSKLPQKKFYLYQAYVVHLLAGWQDFHKELVTYAFAELKKNSENSAINSIAEKRVSELLVSFNTPSTQNIDSLYAKALGVDKVSKAWFFDGVSNEVAKQLLDEVLKSRHQIAHKGFTKQSLTYDSNFEIMEVLYNMACKTQDYVFASLNVD